MAEQGNRRAAGVLKALRTLSFQLSGAQLGITITSLLVGFLVEPSLAPLVEPVLLLVGLPDQSIFGVSVAIGLVVATSFQMVIGELVPKNLAIARPLPTAFATATPLRVVNAIFRPLVVFLNAAANATVRLMGIEPRDEISSVHSLEELQVLIRSAREGGGLEEEEFSLLARSIRFGDKTAAAALTPRVAVVGLPENASIEELRNVAFETGHSRFPVYADDLDHITGVAHVKDSYAIEPGRRRETRVSEITRPPLVVPETKDLASLLAEMRRERSQLVVVVDEFGGTAGILTLEDLLEEIVGEIEDEYDTTTTEESHSPEGISVLSGMLHPDELLEQTGFVLPEGDYETLGGFLLSLFDRIPNQGDQIEYDGWEFKVIAMDGHRIDQVLMVAPLDGGRER